MSVSVKHLRSAQSSRLHKLGASGSLKLARKGEHAPRKYASGGGVDASPIDGAPARPRLDKPGRKMAGKSKDKKGGTNVNVIVMPKGGDGPGAPPPMPMPPPGAGPGGPPPGPPGPPMPPMRKHGGAVGRYATGGKVRKAGGGGIGSDAKYEVGDLGPSDRKFTPPPQKPQGTIEELKRATGGRIANLGHYAHGGKIKQANESEDEGTKLPKQKSFGKFGKGGKC